MLFLCETVHRFGDVFRRTGQRRPDLCKRGLQCPERESFELCLLCARIRIPFSQQERGNADHVPFCEGGVHLVCTLRRHFEQLDQENGLLLEIVLICPIPIALRMHLVDQRQEKPSETRIQTTQRKDLSLPGVPADVCQGETLHQVLLEMALLHEESVARGRQSLGGRRREDVQSPIAWSQHPCPEQDGMDVRSKTRSPSEFSSPNEPPDEVSVARPADGAVDEGETGGRVGVRRRG